MNNIIRVGYDIDGTLANFIKSWTGQAQRMFSGIEQIVDDTELDEYDLHKKYGKKANAVWNAIENQPLFYKEIEPFEDAVQSTRSIISLDEVEPHYITARAGQTIKNYFGQKNRHQEKRIRSSIKKQTSDWLQNYGLRGQLHMREDKGKAASDVGLDFYIDNNPESALDVQYKSSTRSYLLDKKYNRDVTVRRRVPDVETFNNEVKSLVDKL